MAASMEVLFIEDSADDIAHTASYIEQEAPHISLTVAHSLEQARSELLTHPFDGVVVDHDPPDGSGIGLQSYLHEIGSHAVMVVVTEPGNYALLKDVFRQGIVHHVPKVDCYWECLPILLEQAINFSQQLAVAQKTTPADLAERRDQLMSRIAHEVKTPLTSILGFAHMLVTKPDAPLEKRQKWANFIHSKSQQLSGLIDNMLDLSELQSGQVTIMRTPTDLREVVSDAVAEMEGIAPTRVINTTIPADLPKLNIDAERISHVIINLLSNAHNVTSEGQPIEIEVRNKPDTIEVAVTDHGPGLPRAEQEYVFEPFSAEPGGGYQVGKGLWLPLARAIVEAHNGRLWLEQGSVFILSLPK